MDDLIKLNRRIAEHWLGRLDANQEAYLSHTPVCLGRLTPSAAELAQVLSCSMQKLHDPLSVAKLNCMYLHFARLAAKDVAAGKPEMLIKLGIGLEQAEILASLTNEQIARLGFDWDGPILRFPSKAFKRGVALHVRAAQHHAAALVAANFAPSIGTES